ncbi:MAG TPA: NAD(P)/FAD-dependent oxidoreductase [Nocardioidaceae bacterium]|nr:NAD(P)/FAD-dependent oxidoreductase [Nocardioidaceae bacterium]
MSREWDAVVVGAGPNGLAAAVTLAAAGLHLLVLEGAAEAGGGCRTAALTLPGFRHDVCSAVHPLALASPFFRAFDLPARGVRVRTPEVAFAHPLDGGRAGVVAGSVGETAERLGADGPAWQRTFGRLVRHSGDVVAGILSPLRGPTRHPLPMAEFGLPALLPATRLAGRRFVGEEARALFAGVAAHAMVPLDRATTAATGLLLTMLAHSVGWPFVEGGSDELTAAMAAAVTSSGGEVVTGTWVRSLTDVPPARAVLLDVAPRGLARIAGDRLPPGYRHALARYRHGPGVCKVDFALSGPVPWAAGGCRSAGTLHLGGALEEVAAAEAEVADGRHPERPYVLVAQPGVVDPSRAPETRHTLWAYCHVPAGSSYDMTARIEGQIERFAPGFRDLVLARHTTTAAREAAANPNYVGGDIACGVQDLRQTLFRPVRRWNTYRTPVEGLYLCSAATPPGPGVHGRCGQLAALTALRDRFGVRNPPSLAPAATSLGGRAR